MSKHRDHLKNVLKSIFTRFVRGNADVEEQHLVDTFYDNVSVENRGDKDFSIIGKVIKKNIDRRIKFDRKKRKIYKIYIPAAACGVLMLFFASFFVYRLNSIFFVVKPHEQFCSLSPTVTVGGKQFDNLLKETPKGSFFKLKGEEQVLDLKNISQEQSSDTIIIENPSFATLLVFLRDGSQVKLGAKARITFDGEFNKSRRFVHASGELYFDISSKVTNGKKIPFIVETKMQTIEVLGTKFFVNSHKEEEESILLKEGRVKLEHNYSKREVILRPGQQAFLKKDTPQIYVGEEGEEAGVDAWRNGLFYFERHSIGAVMEELSSWYNIPIEVGNSVYNMTISGTFTRYDKLTEVLDLIEMTNKIQFYEKKGVVYVNRK